MHFLCTVLCMRSLYRVRVIGENIGILLSRRGRKIMWEICREGLLLFAEGDDETREIRNRREGRNYSHKCRWSQLPMWDPSWEQPMTLSLRHSEGKLMRRKNTRREKEGKFDWEKGRCKKMCGLSRHRIFRRLIRDRDRVLGN